MYFLQSRYNREKEVNDADCVMCNLANLNYFLK
jgi:hypothetical protein